ncbi:MAG: triphosphoribosyl-dephospho-CoA synthase CitG [Bacillota bacterium]
MAKDIGFYANQAILYELSATPKPGLVDKRNCGSHNDMDFLTFISSACAIAPYFAHMAEVGILWDSDDIKGLFNAIRKYGQECEKSMLMATNGVNTHKGTIFLMGILSAATGYSAIHKKKCFPDDVCDTAAKMCEGIVRQDFSSLEEKDRLTHGERLYLTYGLTGIRGEAESGFKTVRNVGLPALEEAITNGMDTNSAMLHTLLKLMCTLEDTNVISRCGKDGLDYVMKSAKMVLNAGSVTSPKGLAMLYCLDDDFIARRISPGGSADLLSASFFLHSIKNLCCKI